MSDLPGRDVVVGAQWDLLNRVAVDLDAIVTFDPLVPRDPRLLVPVDLQAYVVPTAGDQPRADVRARGLDPNHGGRRMPPPFSDGKPLPAGVHLHWALPDGLTQADPDLRGDDATGDLGFRPLPDRWLVARLGPPTSLGLRRSLTAWVVESTTAVVTPLAAWKPEATLPTGDDVIPPTDLHPGSGGDAAWAAVYDSAVGRFGFHDPLEGTGTRPVFSYVVVGWYSVPELDPLHGAVTSSAYHAILDDLAWDVDDSAMATATAKSAERVHGARSLMMAAGGRPGDVRVIASDVVDLSDLVLDPTFEVVETVLPTHPRQSLYHGTVFGVVGKDKPTDGRPKPAAVSLALGPTMADASATVLADDDDQELLLAAFAHRLLEDASVADDWSALDAARHQRAFVALPDPAPPVMERIVRDEPGPVSDKVGPPGSGPRGTGLTTGTGGPKVVTLDFLAGDKRLVEQMSARAVDKPVIEGPGGTGNVGSPVPPPRRIVETIPRPGPRFWQPTDPTLVLLGAGRTLRHGYDGRFEDGDTLACRLTGQPVKAIRGIVIGRDLVPALGHGGIPPECDELLEEAALTDPTAVESIVAVATTKGHPADQTTARISAELVLDRTVRAQVGDVVDLLGHSLQEGVLASPVAAAQWRQPWLPLYVEWEATLDRNDQLTGWSLGELDLAAGSGRPPTTTRTFVGRANLAGAASKALADAMDEFLDREARLDGVGRGVLTDTQADDLAGLAAIARDADLAVAPLAGLLDTLLGFDPDALAEGNPVPVALPELLRGGHLRIDRLRLVDCFGQVLDLASQLPKLELADPYVDPAASGRVLLPPRFTCLSRLRLRFVDAANAAVEARVDETTPLLAVNPVAGFLLPDHADDALEVFGPDGAPLGQLFHRGLGRSVTWEGPPGVDEPTATGPAGTGGVAHLAALTGAVVRRDVAERAAAQSRGLPLPAESPLAALLRVIDTTTWTVDPFGATGTEHGSVLLGRPIAVVRATLGFDLLDDQDAVGLTGADAEARAAAFAALADRAVPVRLGSLTRFDDGLLGFFVDDDYTTLHPVHPAVLELALPVGTHQGFLGTVDEAKEFGETLPTVPISAGYVSGDATITIRPGQTRTLTLLLLPGHGVHATSGVVPRKRLELSRSWIAEPLGRIVPSFRVGPVLVDPEAIRMPPISAIGPAQAWTRRVTPASWRDDPIAAASDVARLPDTPAQAQEGWVRARLEGE